MTGPTRPISLVLALAALSAPVTAVAAEPGPSRRGELAEGRRLRPQDGIVADSYERQLAVRLWVGGASQNMYDSRVAIREENRMMLSSGLWLGTVDDSAVTEALAGGLEVAYGFTPDLKAFMALETRGTSAGGVFDGVGSNAVTDPLLGVLRQQVTRTNRYAAFGPEVGATLLMREYGWSRFGLTGRIGVHSFSGSSERGEEDGPIRTFWWERKLSGTAVGGLVGVEWEWLTPLRPLPFTGYFTFGYRWLRFGKVSFDYADSTGIEESGAYKNPDGTFRRFDFSGPEVRIGLQVLVPYSAGGFERRRVAPSRFLAD